MLGERELQDIWYGGNEPPLALRLVAAVYGAAVRLRAALYRAGVLGTTRLPVPVVVVGNLTAGGAGKTPMTIALVEALGARGLRVGVVSRGYGGSARVPSLVGAASDPAVVGDEPCLIARATGAPVAVGRRRADAGRLLLASAPLDVLIADDGLQHPALGRNVEICVIDGERRFGNGRLLPAGPLREPVERLERVDYRVCNGGAPRAGEIAMLLAGDHAVALAAPNARRALQAFGGRRVHAVAGIANPQRFFARLRACGIEPIEHAFGDHHAFTPADIEFGDGLPVLMTEKDAVKCAAFAGGLHWFVPVCALLPTEFLDDLAARIRASAVLCEPPGTAGP